MIKAGIIYSKQKADMQISKGMFITVADKESDNDDFIALNASIQRQLGYNPQFSNFSKFNALMLSGHSLKL